MLPVILRADGMNMPCLIRATGSIFGNRADDGQLDDALRLPRFGRGRRRVVDVLAQHAVVANPRAMQHAVAVLVGSPVHQAVGELLVVADYALFTVTPPALA